MKNRPGQHSKAGLRKPGQARAHEARTAKTRGKASEPSPSSARLVMALPKGRIAEEAAALLARAGINIGAVFDGSRKLIHDCGALRVLILRSADVPTYVAHGAADVGIAGSDVLDEHASDLYEPLDLGIGMCRMIMAEPAHRPVDESSQMHVRIATKYPRITRNYLQRKGLTAEIIELSGSIELGPLTGLADRIVDITQTGETLRQNGLVEVETIAQISSRLVVNPAALKLRGEAIARLIQQLESAVEKTRRA